MPKYTNFTDKMKSDFESDTKKRSITPSTLREVLIVEDNTDMNEFNENALEDLRSKSSFNKATIQIHNKLQALCNEVFQNTAKDAYLYNIELPFNTFDTKISETCDGISFENLTKHVDVYNASVSRLNKYKTLLKQDPNKSEDLRSQIIELENKIDGAEEESSSVDLKNDKETLNKLKKELNECSYTPVNTIFKQSYEQISNKITAIHESKENAQVKQKQNTKKDVASQDEGLAKLYKMNVY